MSWTDDLDFMDELFGLGFFGVSGFIIFIFVCVFCWCSHKNTMEHGIKMKIVDIGTCTEECVIKVKRVDDDTVVEQRTTKGKVFVNDIVTCNDTKCYKD